MIEQPSCWLFEWVLDNSTNLHSKIRSPTLTHLTVLACGGGTAITFPLSQLKQHYVA
jgi:hypothetical protein